MRRHIIALAAVLAVFAACAAPPAHALPGGSAVRAAVREIVEWAAKRGNAAAARELAEYGGREAVERLAQRCLNEGGETAVARLSARVAQHGPAVLRAVDAAPARLLATLDDIPAESVPKALAYMGRNSAEAAEIAARHGADGIALALRSPAAAPRALQAFDGALSPQALGQLGDDGILHLARFSREVGALPAAQRSALAEGIRRTPGKTAEAIGRADTWKDVVLRLGALGITVSGGLAYASQDALAGTYVDTPDGPVRVPGLLDEPLGVFARHAGTGVSTGVIIVSSAVALAAVIAVAYWARRRKRATRKA